MVRLNYFKYPKWKQPEEELKSKTQAFKRMYLSLVCISLHSLLLSFLGLKMFDDERTISNLPDELLLHSCLFFSEIGFSSCTGTIFILMNRQVRTKSSEFLTETAKVSIHKGANMYWLIEDPKNLKLKSDAKTATESYSKRNTSPKLSQRLVFFIFLEINVLIQDRSVFFRRISRRFFSVNVENSTYN